MLILVNVVILYYSRLDFLLNSQVVCASDPIQTKGLLRASILDKNPVIFLEPKCLYRNAEDEVPNEDYEVLLNKLT